MRTPENEAPLNHRLMLDQPGRQFVAVEGSRWGELILPAASEQNETHAGCGLRLVLFASFEYGYLALEAVKAYLRRFPGRVQLIALVTDDPVNPQARIGLKNACGSSSIAKRRSASRPLSRPPRYPSGYPSIRVRSRSTASAAC